MIFRLVLLSSISLLIQYWPSSEYSSYFFSKLTLCISKKFSEDGSPNYLEIAGCIASAFVRHFNDSIRQYTSRYFVYRSYMMNTRIYSRLMLITMNDLTHNLLRCLNKVAFAFQINALILLWTLTIKAIWFFGIYLTNTSIGVFFLVYYSSSGGI